MCKQGLTSKLFLLHGDTLKDHMHNLGLKIGLNLFEVLSMGPIIGPFTYVTAIRSIFITCNGIQQHISVLTLMVSTFILPICFRMCVEVNEPISG